MRHYLFLFLIVFAGLTAQGAENINFHVLDVKAGISDNYIQDIMRDRYSFVWIATKNGLNRYDGYHFKQYATMHLGGYDNCVEWISEDLSGRIWIKTPVNYCYYDREKDEFRNDIHTLLSGLGIQGEAKHLFIDTDQNLWCIVANTLYYYRFANRELLSLPIPATKEIIDLTCRESNAYLLFSDGQIAAVHWEACSIEEITSTILLPDLPYQIYLDTADCLWVFAVHASGIKCYSPQEREWISFPGQKELNEAHNFITAVTDDGNGNIWIGTDNRGIYICHASKGPYSRLYKEAGKMFSLSSNHITCFCKDSQNIMWIGTSKQGVSYSCLNGIAFENFRCPEQEDVSCLLEDSKGHLWLGFDGEGIARYDSMSPSYTSFQSKNTSLPSDLIVCSFLDSKQRLWWGSFGDGAFYYDNGQFVRLSNLLTGQTTTPVPLYIRRMAEDDNGQIWLATYTQGLFCLDTQGELTNYTLNNSILKTNYIADLFVADGRYLYIGTSTGLYCMDTYSRKLMQLDKTKNGQEIAQDNFVNCVYADSRGLLWIGGRKGINIYNKKTDDLVYLSTDNGLSHPYVRAMTEDANKNMWVATDHGITWVNIIDDPDAKGLKYRCFPYYEKDGLGNYTFNNFSIICNRQNEILIGGSGGYVKIRPQSSASSRNDHKIMFTGLFLANQRMEVGVSTPDGRVLLNKNIQLLDEITMEYSDSNFALEISAMDYGNLHKLQYAYRLSDKEEWIKLEGNRIYFNKLSPGTHQLQVKVNDKQAFGANLPSLLTIHVRPPFWLSVPAYMCYASLLMLTVFLSIRRIRQKHQKVLKQQKRDMEIAQQQEMNETKIRFFTNISHDLRTPLSLILSPLEKLLAAASVQKEVKEDLDLMHRNAITLLNEVNQMLDFRQLDKQKTQLSVSYGNLAEFIKGICTSFNALSARHGIKMHLQSNSPTIEMNFDRNKMQRIMMNLLSNAIKYNHEHGSITVTIDKTAAPEGEKAIIRVADTGIGIKNENKAKVFDRFYQEARTAMPVGSGIGLHIVKEYVFLHKGDISIEDNYPQGTVFQITLPMGSDTDAPNFSISSELEVEQPGVAQPTILLVEDHDDFRRFLVNCLREHYRVVEASDGAKALKVLSEKTVHLVVSDVMMPQMDGMELCHAIKTNIRYSHIPVILLTARTAEEHILNGLKEGADDYLTKPFNLEIFLLRVRKILEWTKSSHEKFRTIDVSPAEITVSTLDEQLIAKAIQAVEENMDNTEFSVEDMSAYVGMSRGHLYKKLVQITGRSPIEFIRIIRLKRGRQLIGHSQLSISQIAYQTGLSPKQFAKYFKEEFGCSPSDYRPPTDTPANS